MASCVQALPDQRLKLTPPAQGVKNSIACLFLQLPLSLFIACAHPGQTPSTDLSSPTTPAVISGVVSDAYSGKPLQNAQVGLQETEVQVATDRSGHYRIGPVPSGTYTVRVRLIGYTPLMTTVTVPDTGPFQLNLQLTYPGGGPPADSSLFLLTWALAVGQYRPHEAQHVNTVFQRTAVGRDSTNAGDIPLVLQLHRELRRSIFARHLLDSLVARGLATKACYDEKDVACAGEGFATFLTLERPRHPAPDTITVRLEEVAINRSACRRHQESFGGSHSVTLEIVKRDTVWVFVGPVGIAMSGTVVCGH